MHALHIAVRGQHREHIIAHRRALPCQSRRRVFRREARGHIDDADIARARQLLRHIPAHRQNIRGRRGANRHRKARDAAIPLIGVGTFVRPQPRRPDNQTLRAVNDGYAQLRNKPDNVARDVACDICRLVMTGRQSARFAVRGSLQRHAADERDDVLRRIVADERIHRAVFRVYVHSRVKDVHQPHGNIARLRQVVLHIDRYRRQRRRRRVEREYQTRDGAVNAVIRIRLLRKPLNLRAHDDAVCVYVHFAHIQTQAHAGADFGRAKHAHAHRFRNRHRSGDIRRNRNAGAQHKQLRHEHREDVRRRLRAQIVSDDSIQSRRAAFVGVENRRGMRAVGVREDCQKRNFGRSRARSSDGVANVVVVCDEQCVFARESRGLTGGADGESVAFNNAKFLPVGAGESPGHGHRYRAAGLNVGARHRQCYERACVYHHRVGRAEVRAHRELRRGRDDELGAERKHAQLITRIRSDKSAARRQQQRIVSRTEFNIGAHQRSHVGKQRIRRRGADGQSRQCVLAHECRKLSRGIKGAHGYDKYLRRRPARRDTDKNVCADAAVRQHGKTLRHFAERFKPRMRTFVGGIAAARAQPEDNLAIRRVDKNCRIVKRQECQCFARRAGYRAQQCVQSRPRRREVVFNQNGDGVQPRRRRRRKQPRTRRYRRCYVCQAEVLPRSGKHPVILRITAMRVFAVARRCITARDCERADVKQTPGGDGDAFGVDKPRAHRRRDNGQCQTHRRRDCARHRVVIARDGIKHGNSRSVPGANLITKAAQAEVVQRQCRSRKCCAVAVCVTFGAVVGGVPERAAAEALPPAVQRPHAVIKGLPAAAKMHGRQSRKSSDREHARHLPEVNGERRVDGYCQHRRHRRR